MEVVLIIAAGLVAYFYYMNHRSSSDVESIQDVIYRFTERLRLAQAEGYHEDHYRIEWMVKWLDTGLSAKLSKTRLTVEEKSELGKAAGYASSQNILNLIGVYPGTKQYWRYSEALLRLMEVG